MRFEKHSLHKLWNQWLTKLTTHWHLWGPSKKWCYLGPIPWGSVVTGLGFSLGTGFLKASLLIPVSSQGWEPRLYILTTVAWLWKSLWITRNCFLLSHGIGVIFSHISSPLSMKPKHNLRLLNVIRRPASTSPRSSLPTPNKWNRSPGVSFAR